MKLNLDPGTIIDERYRLEKELGSGASGTVFLAKDIDLGREVAIKLLNLDSGQDSNTFQRFEREAKALSSLLHPNIVRVYRFGLLDNRHPFLVMEYAGGQSLRSRLEEKKQLSCQEAVLMAEQICSALEYAHSSGIVHRDIKPENLIISETAMGTTVKLLDFGLCKQIEPEQGKTLTQTGSVLGTAFYMSPEQCMGKDVDWRSDIYSFACVLFEMITGDPPFLADNHSSIMLKHLSDPMPSICELAPSSGLPKELDELIVKSCSKKKEDRYQSFSELRLLLTDIAKLNCRKFFNRQEAQRQKTRKQASFHLPRNFVRNFALVFSFVSASLAFYLLGTESGNKVLSTQIQNNLSVDDSIKSLSEIVANFLAAGNKDAANKVVQTSIKSSRFRSWSDLDRQALLREYVRIYKNHNQEKEAFSLTLDLLVDLLESVQNHIQKKGQSWRKSQDEVLKEQLQELSKLCLSLYKAKHERKEWSQISHALESKWSLGPGSTTADLLWLWVLRVESWRLRGVSAGDAKDLGKYYTNAAGCASNANDLETLKMLVQVGSKHCVEYGAYNRATLLHVVLGDYYLERGRLDMARAELLEAQKLSDGHGLSNAEQGALDRLTEGCQKGAPVKRVSGPPKVKGMPVIYQEVLKNQ